MRVLFWGSPEFAVKPLEALCESVHQVGGVVCQPDRPGGRGRKITAPAVKKFALSRGLSVLQPPVPRGEEFLALIKSLKPDISVVVAYGQILRPEVLSVPGHGSINLHASLLPAYRGAAPIQRAIAAGETVTGLTVIQMDEGLDTGPMLTSQRVEIGERESAGELAGRLSTLGARLLVELLDRIAAGQPIKPVPQPEERVSHAPKVSHEEARIDWTLPAEKISCLIRAFDPMPGAFSFRQGAILKLFRPAAASHPAGRPGEGAALGKEGLAVSCGDGRAILVGEIQAPGKRRMSAADYLRGAGMEIGEVLV
jgi:methionyl-tRNA formyltransferase